jgi:hypothetical protein
MMSVSFNTYPLHCMINVNQAEDWARTGTVQPLPINLHLILNSKSVCRRYCSLDNILATRNNRPQLCFCSIP